MSPKHLRFIVAGAPFAFLFLVFVPVVYEATMFPCKNSGCSFSCVLCPSNPSGFKSIGSALFDWGGIYSLDNFPQSGGYTFSPDGFFALGGRFYSNLGAFLFFVLPIATAGAGLLEPEILRRTRFAKIGYGVLGLLMFSISVSSFALEGFGLSSALLGTGTAIVGFAIIIFPLIKWTLGVPNPNSR